MVRCRRSRDWLFHYFNGPHVSHQIKASTRRNGFHFENFWVVWFFTISYHFITCFNLIKIEVGKNLVEGGNPKQTRLSSEKIDITCSWNVSNEFLFTRNNIITAAMRAEQWSSDIKLDSHIKMVTKQISLK